MFEREKNFTSKPSCRMSGREGHKRMGIEEHVRKNKSRLARSAEQAFWLAVGRSQERFEGKWPVSLGEVFSGSGEEIVANRTRQWRGTSFAPLMPSLT